MYAKLCTIALSLAFALPLMAQRSAPATGKAVDPLATGEIFNIVDWDGGQLPQRYRHPYHTAGQSDDWLG